MINLTKNDISLIMANSNYGVCYEPIIRINDMEIIGYEALSRFKLNDALIPPNIIFKALHKDLEMFFHIEVIMKKFQLEHRPNNKTLFLNLDPDVALQSKQMNFWINLLKSQENIVVEIIENTDEEDVENMKDFMEWMKMNKIDYAYDDFAKPNSIFFYSLLETAQYIKLDMHLLSTIRCDKHYTEFVKGIVQYAKAKKKYTILEGVETESDLEIAKAIKVDYIQGHLFKNLFSTTWMQ